MRAENAKSRRARTVPLHRAIADELRRWRGNVVHLDPEARVFPDPATGRRRTDVSRAWRALCRAAQVRDFRLHDCRHDFASRLAMRGVPLDRIRDLLGHSSITLTERYAHLRPGDLEDAVAELAQEVAR